MAQPACRARAGAFQRGELAEHQPGGDSEGHRADLLAGPCDAPGHGGAPQAQAD
jgi:hypothetical protein